MTIVEAIAFALKELAVEEQLKRMRNVVRASAKAVAYVPEDSSVLAILDVSLGDQYGKLSSASKHCSIAKCFSNREFAALPLRSMVDLITLRINEALAQMKAHCECGDGPDLSTSLATTKVNLA